MITRTKRSEKHTLKRFKKGGTLIYVASPTGRIHWYNADYAETYYAMRQNTPALAWPKFSEVALMRDAIEFYEGDEVLRKVREKTAHVTLTNTEDLAEMLPSERVAFMHSGNGGEL